MRKTLKYQYDKGDRFSGWDNLFDGYLPLFCGRSLYVAVS